METNNGFIMDPITERTYYLLDSYSQEVYQLTQQKIWELQIKLNDELQSRGSLSLNDYFEIMIENWPEDDKRRFRMRHIYPEDASKHGWSHKVGDIEYAFLQVRSDLEDDKTIIMLEPFPIPEKET